MLYILISSGGAIFIANYNLIGSIANYIINIL